MAKKNPIPERSPDPGASSSDTETHPPGTATNPAIAAPGSGDAIERMPEQVTTHRSVQDTDLLEETTVILDVNPMVRYPLLAFNLVIWFMGAGMMAVALYTIFDGWYTDDDGEVLSTNNLHGLVFTHIEIVIFALGLTLFVISLCGCVGSLRENTFLLRLYSISLDILIMWNLILGIVVFFMPGRRLSKQMYRVSIYDH